MNSKMKSTTQGFTLVQSLIVLFIIAILVGIGAPNVLDYNKRSKGTSCANNMRNIQAAKDAWAKDYPQHLIIPSDAALVSYLKGPIPICPAGGTYQGTLDCNVVISCSLNGNPSHEPLDATPLEANGYHDLAMPQ